jgi:membrane-associated PAP2 superfamily phosphatase
MNSSGGPIAAYRRYWFPELVALAAFALATTVLFAVTDLDIVAARWFYHPELADPWPIASQSLWLLFYRSAPWVTGSLAIVGVTVLVVGVIRKKSRQFRLYGLFILLCVILGPGLTVNKVLKDHWGHPRPRQIVEFGGRLEYTPPPLPASAHGKSFPCGHCSVGYLYAIGWWLWRRRRPQWAVMSLATGLVLGTLLGLGRMAAGAHFLSDNVWSALIAYGVAHVIYYYGLRIPAREDSRAALYPLIEGRPRMKAAAVAAAILLGLGIIGGGLLATPHYDDLTTRVRLADFPAQPEAIEVIVDTLDVEITLVTGPSATIECTGYVHGFGLPNNVIRWGWEFVERPVPTLRYRVTEKGWFTDLDGVARIRLPRQHLRKIIVRAKHGDISVVDATGKGIAAGHFPTLDLHTADGRVKQP